MTTQMSRLPRSPSMRTSRSRFSGILVATVAAALALSGNAQSLHAQDNSIAGQVRASGTNEPLSNAQISVARGTPRAVSDAEGKFRITGLTGTVVTLDVRRIGYRTEHVSARVGQTDLVISLVSNPT